LASYCQTSFDGGLPDLTGAEFKIASYLCGQLEKQAVVGTTITSLSRATGVSWRHTQAYLQSLVKGRRVGGS
jgi:hypothetical protein